MSIGAAITACRAKKWPPRPTQVKARQVIVAVGESQGLSLESVGIDPNACGVGVDERAARPSMGIGDVTGEIVADAAARIADIVGEPARADYHAVPRVLFTNPEVAAVGMSEREAREAGQHAGAHLHYATASHGPWTYEPDPRGELAVIADARRKTLVGAWAVGPLSEWIHYAALPQLACRCTPRPT